MKKGYEPKLFNNYGFTVRKTNNAAYRLSFGHVGGCQKVDTNLIETLSHRAQEQMYVLTLYSWFYRWTVKVAVLERLEEGAEMKPPFTSAHSFRGLF